MHIHLSCFETIILIFLLENDASVKSCLKCMKQFVRDGGEKLAEGGAENKTISLEFLEAFSLE